MPEINICDSAGRDALVAIESVRSGVRVRWVDSQSRQAVGVRLLKGTLDRDLDALVAKYGELPKIGQALIEGDPEVDLENSGRMLRDTSRVYVDPDRQIVHKVKFWEIICNPDGSERERRPRKLLDPNLAGPQPLRWTGVFIKREV